MKLEIIRMVLFFSPLVFLLAWGWTLLYNRDKRWEEEARLKAEQEASQA